MRALALSIPVLVAVVAGCEAETAPLDRPFDELIPAAQGPIAFRDACRPGTRITVAAVGDVLLHDGLQRQAYESPRGHHSLWSDVEPLLSGADLTYGNLEGPAAKGVTTSGPATDPGKRFDGNVYSGYPQFNYHPSVVTALKESGFDVVSTANNHALDRRALGVDRTIEALDEAGLAFTGTRPEDDASHPWYAVTEAKGVRVAWLACTFSTNGIPDRRGQVLHCYEDKDTVLATIRDLSRKPDVDAVIVTPHWGTEYEHTPASRERGLAHEMLESGALAVVGSHPHVVQPMEKVETSDHREGFVIYSMGNFVSGQGALDRRSSLVLFLGLTKGDDGKVTLNGIRHVPLVMSSGPWRVRPADVAPGAADSLALTTRLLGQWNRASSTAPIVTNPDCH